MEIEKPIVFGSKEYYKNEWNKAIADRRVVEKQIFTFLSDKLDEVELDEFRILLKKFEDLKQDSVSCMLDYIDTKD